MKHYLKYLSALLLFGLNEIVASQISLPSYEIVYLRTLIGSVLLIGLFKFYHCKFNIKENRRDLLFIAASGIAMGTSWMFLYEAYNQIGVSLSSLLYYCGPAIVMMLSPVIFKEKITINKIIGFTTVFAGIILVNCKADSIVKNTWGILCGIISAFMYATMVICNNQSKKIKEIENSVIQLFVSFLTVAVFTVIKQGPVVHIVPNEIIWILLLGIVNTGIGCYLYFSSLDKLPVQTVAICGYLEPLSAVLFSVLILNEKMLLIQIIGAICIIGGAAAAELLKTD